jgi:hypothetical protein
MGSPKTGSTKKRKRGQVTFSAASSLDSPDLCRALFQRFRFSVPLGRMIQRCKIHKALDHIGVVGAEGLLPDCQRALVERLGLGALKTGSGYFFRHNVT